MSVLKLGQYLVSVMSENPWTSFSVILIMYVCPQAIKALKEEGIEVVLMNPNIASVQTNTDNKSPHKADQVSLVHFPVVWMMLRESSFCSILSLKFVPSCI